MAGFIRRYGYFPGTEVITLIEGVIIVDLPPPGSVNGLGVGTVAMIGEFADVSYGVQVSSAGVVSTKPQPVEVFSSQDLLNKVGGFDETIGDTGVSGGNAFLALRNKQFSRLICVPVNLASANAGRCWRALPTNAGASSALPVVPLSAASIAAGREFKTGANRVRIMDQPAFTAIGAFKSGVDGAVTAAGAPGATQTFGSATGNFLNVVRPDGTTGVKAGDLLVLGQIGGALGLGGNADAAHGYGTYRVAADAASATQLTVELQDGSNFDWTSTVAMPWRLHVWSDAETTQGNAANTGCTIPARPLDATVVAATTVGPTVAPDAPSQTTWDPLSGLKFRTHPTGALTYTSTIQAPNPASDATIDALYAPCFDALLTDDLPGREVNIVVPARTSTAIRSKQKSHVLNASAQGVGRITIISPPLNKGSGGSYAQYGTSDVIGDGDPGVGYARDERVVYCWPGAQTFIPEAVNYPLKGADNFLHSDGFIDQGLNFWMASLLSNLPPERNPGQGSAPVPQVMSPILGFQRGISGLGMNDYVQYRQKGIAALRIDRAVGPIFQSGVTTSLTSGQKNINRRRMADFLEDSISQRYNQFAKQPLTSGLKDTIVGETVAFLDELKSVNNPAAQRISGYLVDDKSGNTPDLEAKGIYVVIVKVRTLATADFIVLQAEIGEGVKVTTT